MVSVNKAGVVRRRAVNQFPDGARGSTPSLTTVAMPIRPQANAESGSGIPLYKSRTAFRQSLGNRCVNAA
jgi:hypothetical protein